MLALFLLAVILALTLVFVRFLRAGEARDRLMDVALSPNGRRLMRVFFALVIVFLYAPIAILLVFSFNKSVVPSFPLSGFTLRWYHQFVHNGRHAVGPRGERDRGSPVERRRRRARDPRLRRARAAPLPRAAAA